MRRRRELTAALLAALALGVAAGCGGGGDASGGSDDGGTTTSATEETQTVFEGIDLALSVQEVMELNFEGDLDVRGFVVEANGQTLLCTTSEGNPPTCGKPSLVLVDYEGEVPSSEEIFVTGELSGNRLVVR
jgi:hypothetical protein